MHIYIYAYAIYAAVKPFVYLCIALFVSVYVVQKRAVVCAHLPVSVLISQAVLTLFATPMNALQSRYEIAAASDAPAMAGQLLALTRQMSQAKQSNSSPQCW